MRTFEISKVSPPIRLQVGARRFILPPSMSIEENQAALIEELELFQDWQERYEYVIGLGKKLAPMPGDAKSPDKLIKGCQSQVWLDASLEDGLVRYRADSDSLITKGLIAIFIRVLDAQPPEAILKADMSFIDKTGLKEHLAPTRANALSLMATQMKRLALGFAAASSPESQ
jgi:cysteine desulfuration protein SufE